MISCTEFIPSYSELFSYLDEHYGYEEVQRFWTYLFAPTGKGIPLINFLKKDGLRGAWDYWCGTLKEEAADCTRYFNEKEGWIRARMHYCPSKGRLLELEKELGIKPYPHYCDHCDYYRAALEMEGFCTIRDHLDVDKASCNSMIYDPKVFKGIMTMDDDVEILECNSKNLEYFHPDFHSSLNMGLAYVGDKFGEEVLVDYLTRYTKNVYAKVIAAAKTEGLAAIEANILGTYEKEKATDAVKTELSADGLTVTVSYCPAVKHLRKTGRDVTKWYSHSTTVVMSVLAEAAGYKFTMDSYNEATGAAQYRFHK